RLFVVNAETGQTEVQKFHERPAAISGLTAHDHDIARFDRAVTQSEISRRAKRPDDLQTNPQNCVRAHRAMTHDPRLGRFAVHPFRNKTEIFVITLQADDARDIDVIELLHNADAFFKLHAFRWIDTR